MRTRTTLMIILVAAVLATACGSSEPETVTAGAATDQSPTTADAPEGGASDAADSAAAGDESREGPEAPAADPGDGDDDSASSFPSSADSDDSTTASGTDGSGGSGDGEDIQDPASDSDDDTVSISSDQLDGTGGSADISDPGPSNSGEPVPARDQRTLAMLTDVQFQVLESWPAQVIVEVAGELPSPCHSVWWETAVDGNTYEVQVWAVNPAAGTTCAAVVEPFTDNVFLGGGFVDEDYTIVVNGKSHPLNF